jgi:hypothetical protein
MAIAEQHEGSAEVKDCYEALAPMSLANKLATTSLPVSKQTWCLLTLNLFGRDS